MRKFNKLWERQKDNRENGRKSVLEDLMRVRRSKMIFTHIHVNQSPKQDKWKQTSVDAWSRIVDREDKNNILKATRDKRQITYKEEELDKWLTPH